MCKRLSNPPPIMNKSETMIDNNQEHLYLLDNKKRNSLVELFWLVSTRVVLEAAVMLPPEFPHHNRHTRWLNLILTY